MTLRRLSLDYLRIGLRLRLAFLCLIVLMTIGGAVSLWQFREVNSRAAALTDLSERMSAVQRLDNSVLVLMARLHRGADLDNSQHFQDEATKGLADFQAETAGILPTLLSRTGPTERHAVLVASVVAMVQALPARVASLSEFAASEDWPALHARLMNQVDHSDDVVDALMKETDAELDSARDRLSADIERAQSRAAQALIFTTGFTLLAAALLGLIVTGSITRPLARVQSGARALARGDFNQRIDATGNDELSFLADAFNRTTLDLQHLYERVRNSEERFRSLIEKASDLTLIVNSRAEVSYASPSIERLLGLTAEAVMGRPLSTLLAEDHEADRLVAELAPGASRSFELRWLHQDGSERILEGAATNLLGEPSVAGFVINAHDVSERRSAEEALRRNEEQIRLITDALPVHISYVDRGHAFRFNNRVAEDWFRRPRHELEGCTLAEVLSAESYARFLPFVEQALAAKSAMFETTIQHERWGERHVRTTLIPDLDETGKVLGFVALTEDITADRKSRAELSALLAREKEARKTAQLLNRVGPTLAAKLDGEHIAQAVTDLAAELVGAQFGAFLARGDDRTLRPWRCCGAPPISGFMNGPLRCDPFWADTGTLILSGEESSSNPLREEVARLGASYLAAPIVSRSGALLGALVFSHSEAGRFSSRHENMIKGICAQTAIALDNARLFEELQTVNSALGESNERLRRANNDLNQFAYSASHDLQEPLRAVTVYSQLLRSACQGKLPGKADDYARYISEGAQSMSELLKDLRAYMQASEDSGVERCATDSSAGLASALANLQAAVVSSGAEITYDRLPAVSVQKIHLQQLFQNLVGNAIKYRGDRTPRITITAAEAGGSWEFSVKDNGIGIPPQYRGQIFGLFKRLHNRGTHPGTGIGLAICQRIVERYGGRIWVESVPGEGSDFRFTLPAAHAAEQEHFTTGAP